MKIVRTVILLIICSLFFSCSMATPDIGDEFLSATPFIRGEISIASVDLGSYRPDYSAVSEFESLVQTKKTVFAASDFSESGGQGGFEVISDSNTRIDEPITVTFEDSSGLEPVEQTELSYFVYRVKQGDMIGILAEAFNVTQDTIISANSIKQSRLIQIGQYLKIPSMPGILYTVRNDGETIEKIASSYSISAEKCASVNKVGFSDSLKAGTSLFLPDAKLDWVTRQEINGDLFVRPLKAWYYISSPFGWRDSPITGNRSYHGGIDMAALKGTKIYAALAGRVTFAGWSDTYGNYVIVTHHSGYKTLYGHMDTIKVTKGQNVTTETVLGLVGSTGMSTGPHLHFTVYKNDVAVNPASLWN